MSLPHDRKLLRQLAVDFLEAWDQNDEDMGEWAAFSVTCEQFQLEWDEGHELLCHHPRAKVVSGRQQGAPAVSP